MSILKGRDRSKVKRTGLKWKGRVKSGRGAFESRREGIKTAKHHGKIQKMNKKAERDASNWKGRHESGRGDWESTNLAGSWGDVELGS